MIKANELRIGNLLLFQDEINTINSHEIYLIEYEEHIASLYNEIPLTEEWLLKFGFEEQNSNHKYYKFGCAIFRGLGDSVNRFYYHRAGHSKCIEIKHVHSLQNLYFALTNEELTIIENDKDKD